MKIVLDLQGAQTESRLRGIGRQALSLAEAIIAEPRGHEVTVLLNAGLDTNLVALTQHLAGLLPVDRIVTFRPPGAVAERNAGNLWRTRAAELLRETTIARLQPDLVHVSSLFEGYVDHAVTSIGQLQTEALAAATLHDLIPLADPERYLADEGPRRHWLRRAQSLKRADLLVSVSEASRRDAANRLHIAEDRIAVISAGVDPRFRPAMMGASDRAYLRDLYGLDRPFLLYVGAVDPRKNVALIFEAVARLPKDVRDRHLIAFAGHLFDVEIGQLRRTALANGIPAEALRFCQHVPDDDLVRLYQACAAFVFPSRHEGFGLPALEAMACGAAVLAANTGSLPEVVGHDDLLFDPDDPADLAGRLQAVLAEDQLRARARDWGLQRAGRFTWPESARRTIEAFEAVHDRAAREGAARSAGVVGRVIARPRLAFLSPLPPEASGIAGYSAALLRELGRFYDIDCVTTGDACDDPWVLANFAIRDLAFFERNAPRYDRIVYSFGNSHFHAHMPALLERFPGVVILHDFFLSDLIDWMSSTGRLHGDGFARELYRTHGFAALLEEKRLGRIAAIDHFACNGVVFRAALGVIVHSGYAIEQARRLFGSGMADRMTALPHLKAVPVAIDRQAARRRLGLADGDLLVCSFGVLTRRKCSRELVEAWQTSEVCRKPGARLVLLGTVSDEDYGNELQDLIRATQATIAIAGYATPESYRDHLAATDIAVQLRTTSRGETSGAILDCLAYGVPVISNAHGPTEEYPASVLVKLPDAFSVHEVKAAVDALATDPHRRQTLGGNAQAYVRAHHHPGRVGERFFSVIERASTNGTERDERTLLGAIAAIPAEVAPDRADLLRVAGSIASLRPTLGPPQLLYDVTVLAEHDARTGIQRVVRALFQQLAARELHGHRIEPVRMDGPILRYAREFAARALGVSPALPDEVCIAGPDDIYLSIDWVPDRLPALEPWLAEFRRGGGRVVIGVHDLLPFDMPQHFPAETPKVTRRWFESCLRVASGFVCVSATVAGDVVRHAAALIQDGYGPVAVDVVHNAADFEVSLASKGHPADAAAVLAAIAGRPTFLMVGTVEPRKGHLQVLAGFELLWRDGLDVGLAMVGKKGWLMGGFETRVLQHRERGHRLLWLQGASDDYLRDMYAASTALVAASEGEGFGLPLIEAGRLGLPLIARDIPVFREVANGHAFFFDGLEPRDIAAAIVRWLDLNRGSNAPSPVGMPVKTWAESADDLVDVLFSVRPPRAVISAPSHGTADPDTGRPPGRGPASRAQS